MVFFIIFTFMFNSIKTFIIGIIIGIANVIPGVSGGTLVVVFNIYDKFVNAITLNIKKIINNWKFILPLFLGMAIGIIFFSKGITLLYKNYPIQANYFFSGLIAGSIPLLFKYSIKKYDSKQINSKLKYALIGVFILIGILIILGFETLQKTTSDSVKSTILPDFSLSLSIKLLIGGILAAFAMIIPGISGSLLLLTMGVYTTIISAISAFFSKETILNSLFIIIPTGIGILIGLFLGAKLISILIKKIPNYSYSVILGLIIGSLIIIFPGFSNINGFILFASSICFLLGFCLAYFSSKFSKE